MEGNPQLAFHAHERVLNSRFVLTRPSGIKRCISPSATDLIRCIHAFARNYNNDASPFVWVATDQSVSTRSSD